MMKLSPHPFVQPSLARGPALRRTARKACAAALVVAALPAAAAREQNPWAELSTELANAMAFATQLGDETLRWVGRELGQERIVKGAPYCADAVHETIQPLADGNRIVNKQTTRLCRDGEGRTRQDVVSKDGKSTVYLRDPVAREAWVLDPERKTARRSSLVFAARSGTGGDINLDPSAWREFAERMREWARQMGERARDASRPGSSGATAAPAAPATPEPSAMPGASAAPIPAAPPTPPMAGAPEPVVISRQESSSPGGRRRDVEVEVLRLPREAPAMPPLPGMPSLNSSAAPPAVRFNAQRFAPRGPGEVTALPARDMEGVRVNGERTTWTIEAGKLGNEKPIVITREVWTSPELMITVMTRDSDPRSGETHYRLQNLTRGEPDASLMKVPADYQTTRPSPPPATRPPPPTEGATQRS